MSVFKRGRKWHYDFWVNGKRYRGSIPEARVKAQAERAEHTIRDKVYQNKYGKQENTAPLLREFITDTFLPWSKVNKRTWVHDEFRSRPLIKALGNKPMDDISPILIEKYKQDRRASKTARGGERAPSTVNRELELLSKVFSLAIDQGLSIPNPCRKVKRFREDNERNRYLSDEEEVRLLSVLTGPRSDLRPLVVLAIHTGMRRGELFSLRWRNVDFERGLIHVMNSQREQTKSGRSRSIPVNRIARRELLGLHHQTGLTEYVFFNEKSQKPRTDLKSGFRLPVVLPVSTTSIFTISDILPRPGLPMREPTLEKLWRFSGIAAFKHRRVTLTPRTRVYDVQWRRLRNGKRDRQKSPNNSKTAAGLPLSSDLIGCGWPDQTALSIFAPVQKEANIGDTITSKNFLSLTTSMT